MSETADAAPAAAAPADPLACPGCEVFAASQPHLVGAAASVGIEHGKSTGQVVREYLAGYHQRGHQELS